MCDARDVGSPLEMTVAELHRELDGMRASARLRAIIEQAKGVLMAREGLTAEEAFAQLRRLSQHHNVRLVEVATSVVALASPPRDGVQPPAQMLVADAMPVSQGASASWQALRDQIRDEVAGTLLDTIAESTRQGDHAAQLVADLLAPDKVSIVTLYRLAASGALHLVGQVGLPGDVTAAWAVIPPTPDLPLTHALAHDRAMFWGTRAEREARFPATSGLRLAFDATAMIPIHEEPDGGRVIGGVSLAWAGARVFTDADRDRIVGLVSRVARLMLPNLRAQEPELAWLTSLQALHLDPWLILEVTHAVSQPDTPRFRVRDTSLDLPGATEWLGRCLLELWPDLATDGTWNNLAALARDGGAWSTTVTAPTSAPWGTPGSRLRALRLGHHLVLVWRPWLARRPADPDPAAPPTAVIDLVRAAPAVADRLDAGATSG